MTTKLEKRCLGVSTNGIDPSTHPPDAWIGKQIARIYQVPLLVWRYTKRHRVYLYSVPYTEVDSVNWFSPNLKALGIELIMKSVTNYLDMKGRLWNTIVFNLIQLFCCNLGLSSFEWYCIAFNVLMKSKRLCQQRKKWNHNAWFFPSCYNSTPPYIVCLFCIFWLTQWKLLICSPSAFKRSRHSQMTFKWQIDLTPKSYM